MPRSISALYRGLGVSVRRAHVAAAALLPLATRAGAVHSGTGSLLSAELRLLQRPGIAHSATWVGAVSNARLPRR